MWGRTAGSWYSAVFRYTEVAAEAQEFCSTLWPSSGTGTYLLGLHTRGITESFQKQVSCLFESPQACSGADVSR